MKRLFQAAVRADDREDEVFEILKEDIKACAAEQMEEGNEIQ